MRTWCSGSSSATGVGAAGRATEMIAAAERLGYDSVWTAESYGSDASRPSPGGLADHVGAPRDLALPAVGRTPTRWAWRRSPWTSLRWALRARVGVSGPQVVEGWYGQSSRSPWPAPRVRRHRPPGGRPPVRGHEQRPALPAPLSRRTGLGKALKPSCTPCARDPDHPRRRGPKNVALAAEIADGWFPSSSPRRP